MFFCPHIVDINLVNISFYKWISLHVRNLHYAITWSGGDGNAKLVWLCIFNLITIHTDSGINLSIYNSVILASLN